MRDGEHRTAFASESTPLVAPRVVQGDGGVSRILFNDDEKIQLEHPNRISREELNHLAGSFQEEDKDCEKTWARRLVENVLQHQKWYFPRKAEEGAPSLSKAWAYYEHMRLPRYRWSTADHVFRLAEPGETGHKTALFHPWSMPESSLYEFGAGIDQYFQTCAALCVMFFICACINIPSMIYYASPTYSGEGGKKQLPLALQASAICTSKIWVVCNDCTEDEWSWAEEAGTFARAPDGTVLVERNACGGAMIMDGVIDYVTFLFVAIFLSAASYFLYIREVRMDDDVLTADDYSLLVTNPPEDAYDPDEWKEFFEQFAERQVTLVTVALDNEVMVRKLLQRRAQIEKLKTLLPDEVDLDDAFAVRTALLALVEERKSTSRSCVGAFFESCLRSSGLLIPAESIMGVISRLDDDIEELQKNKYNVTSVFVTFETEEGKDAAFSALDENAVQTTKSMRKDQELSSDRYFRGKLLQIDQPGDPSSVRWLDLGTPKIRTVLVMTINLLVTLFLVAIAAFSENKTRKAFGPSMAGPLVSLLNSAIPIIVEILMRFEKHHTEGSWQTSFYTKITVFRWINTAIIIKVFTALTSNLDADSTDVLPSIHAIMWSELIIVPLTRLLDPGGNFKRHVLAPRSMTQDEMNLNFLGTPYRIGERFTALSNILFVCCFYSALFPAVFVFGFAIMLVQYFTDKFCLVRVWRMAPSVGANIARISRRYFFNIALVVFIASSAYSWAQFPYDNLCNSMDEDKGHISKREFSNAVMLNGTVANITVHAEEVYFCSQDVQEFDTVFPFPPTPRIQPDGLYWMTDEQEQVCTVFGWTALAAVVTFLAYFLKEIQAFFGSLFRGSYQPGGRSQRIDFSSHPSIVAYIPHVSLYTLPYPLLTCSVDNVDKSRIGWIDPDNSFDKHNLIFDLPKSRSGSAETFDSVGAQPIFSVVRHYPPEWHRKLQIEREMVGHSPCKSLDREASTPLC